ncbi:MAG: hypothetical protein ACR2IE_09960 [Candidatus Sumerlaeaceae bacterium]
MNFDDWARQFTDVQRRGPMRYIDPVSLLTLLAHFVPDHLRGEATASAMEIEWVQRYVMDVIGDRLTHRDVLRAELGYYDCPERVLALSTIDGYCIASVLLERQERIYTAFAYTSCEPAIIEVLRETPEEVLTGFPEAHHRVVRVVNCMPEEFCERAVASMATLVTGRWVCYDQVV